MNLNALSLRIDCRKGAGGEPPYVPPSASGVTVSGTFETGSLLTGSYTYSGSNPESGSTFQWWQADDELGTGTAAIAGATSITYTVESEIQGKYISMTVAPSDGTETGFETSSPWYGPIAAEQVDPEPTDDGGFIETYAAGFNSTSRSVPTSPTDITYLPADNARGAFTFPAPYATKASRITCPDDCSGGGIDNGNYSYWSRINHHEGRGTLLVAVCCPKSRGGGGVSLFEMDVDTMEVTPKGALFPSTDGRSNFSGEGWSFSLTEWNMLYVVTGEQIQKYNVDPSLALTPAERTTVLFDITDQTGHEDGHIVQCHISADGNTLSGTVQDAAYDRIGAFSYKVATDAFVFYPPIAGGFDEAQIDKSGRYLVIKENIDGQDGEDNRVIDLTDGSERTLLDQAGAAGHSDLGYGIMVAADNWNDENNNYINNAIRVWDFTAPGAFPVKSPSNLIFRCGQGNVIDHMGFGCASSTKSLSDQYFVNSNTVSVSGGNPLENEIYLTRLDGSYDVLVLCPSMTSTEYSGGGSTSYEKGPFANIDSTGEFVCFSSNMCSSRMDAFIVKVPQPAFPA